MTRKCFFVDRIDPGEERIRLTGENAHHIENVLRSKPEDEIEVRDGRGRGWKGVITAIRSGSVEVHIRGEMESSAESPLDLTLALAFARFDRMELVLRQATEMGVSRFVAFRARRSQYGLAGARLRKRMDRWVKITREALCQCGRTRVPEVVILSDMSEFLNLAEDEARNAGGCLKVAACEQEPERSLLSLKGIRPRCSRAVVAVGPEGGWHAEEVDGFGEAGFYMVRLGPRILRLETAAVALVASVQLLWGDFGSRASGREDES